MAGPYRIVALGEQLGIGVADSRYVSIQAVAKTNGPQAPYCIPNELICGEVGRFLGLPIPPGSVVRGQVSTDQVFFASLDFNITGNVLPPIDPADCVARLPELSSGILLFDALVANCDRHTENLAMDASTSPPRLNLFDHSHALFGGRQVPAADRLEYIRNSLALTPGEWTGVARHCLLHAVRSDAHFGFWLDRIARLPDFFIENACQAAINLGITSDEANFAVDFLRHRRNHLQAIIEGSRSDFRSITHWSLFP